MPDIDYTTIKCDTCRFKYHNCPTEQKFEGFVAGNVNVCCYYQSKPMPETLEEILTIEFIELGSTHENAPPHHDCGEECEVSIEDQILASNPITSPMRSGGKKHKKCIACWNDYIKDLVRRIHEAEGEIR